MPHPIPAAFWRGGTSRGILFRARDLAPLPMKLRNQVIMAAMGSPDPDGRQIDGLGGGVSSLSKCGVFSSPGEGIDIYPRSPTSSSSPDPSYLYPDAHPHIDSSRLPSDPTSSWDVVYRFAQVGVRTATVDWASTCGNIISAVACASVSDPKSPIISYERRLEACRPFRLQAFAKGPEEAREPVMIPVKIALANTGDVVTAKVPLDPLTMQLFEPLREGEGFALAGVPGVGAPVELSFPLRREGQLPTGRPRDTLEIPWRGETVALEVTIASTGLINVFIPATALVHFEGLPCADQILGSHPTELDANVELHRFMEEVRKQGSTRADFPYAKGTGEPKVSIVGPANVEEADVRVRAVSVGNFHRTIPGTTLSALAVAASHPDSVVPSTLPSHSSDAAPRMTLRARHPAGTAEATLQLAPAEKGGGAEAVVMMRTAREIMRGEVLIPNGIFG